MDRWRRRLITKLLGAERSLPPSLPSAHRPGRVEETWRRASDHGYDKVVHAGYHRRKEGCVNLPPVPARQQQCGARLDKSQADGLSGSL